MRLRHIHGCEAFVADSPDVISAPEKHCGKWHELFGNENPIELEIGMGKGRFIRELSLKHPERNFLGIERYESVLMKAIQRKDKEEEALPEEKRRKNLYFICDDAARLPEMFLPGEISRIYLNFSDPWPKASHAKRRLTSDRFLKLYEKVLKPEGAIEFKTDNRALFAWSVETVPEAGWEILYQTEDLHAEPDAEDNIMTEYEEKFSGRGQKICKFVIRRKKDD
jgi:tRNA (guanine-N7-)-methyltransferase